MGEYYTTIDIGYCMCLGLNTVPNPTHSRSTFGSDSSSGGSSNSSNRSSYRSSGGGGSSGSSMYS